jgi:hypothetical protein
MDAAYQRWLIKKISWHRLILETQLATPKGGRAEAFSLCVWSSAVVGPAQQFPVSVNLPQMVRSGGDQMAFRVYFRGVVSGEFQAGEMVAKVGGKGRDALQVDLCLAKRIEHANLKDERVTVPPSTLFRATI